MKGREQAVLLLLSTLISLNFVLFRFFFTVGWSRETRWSYSLFLSVRIMLVSKLLQDSITLFDNYALVIAFENSSHILDENQNHLTIQDILLSCFLVVFFFVVIGRGAVSLILRPWLLFFFLIFLFRLTFPDICLYMPCKNGGTCVSDYINGKYTCRCPDGFYGDTCRLGKKA